MKKIIYYVMLVGVSLWASQHLYGQTLPSGLGLYIITATGITVPGVYYLGNDILNTITINADDVVLDLNGKTIDGGFTNNDRITVLANHKNIVIKNGRLINASSSPASGIKINNGENILVDGVAFDNNYLGVYAVTSTNIMVQACTFEDHVDQPAIKLQDCNTCVVEKNVIVRGATSSAYGIELSGSSNNVIRENIISNKVQGILLSNASSNNIIQGNICNRNKVGIFLLTNCINNKISGNICNENNDTVTVSGSGIYLRTGCSKNVVRGNQCTGNASTSTVGGSGIYLSSAVNNVVEDNVCCGNSNSTTSASLGGCGIYVNAATFSVLHRNACLGNSTTNVGNSGSGIYILNSSGSIAQENVCIGNEAIAQPPSSTSESGVGIVVYTCGNNLIEDNTCVGNKARPIGTSSSNLGGTGIYSRGSVATTVNNKFIGNICTGNSSVSSGSSGTATGGSSGMYCLNAQQKAIIKDNVCTSNRLTSTVNGVGVGIFLDGGLANTDNVVEGNIIANNDSSGIDTAGAQGTITNVMRRNKCHKNNIGINVPATSTNNVISYNSCYNNVSTGISGASSPKAYYNAAINNATNYSGPTNNKTQTDLLTTGSFGTNFSGT